MKNIFLLLCIIIVLFPVDLVTKITNRQNVVDSDYVVEGEVAMHINNTNGNNKPIPKPSPDNKSCTCKGTKKIKSGDGYVDIPCPCGASCVCAKTMFELEPKPIPVYHAFMFYDNSCQPCMYWLNNIKPKLEKSQFKFNETSWVDGINVVTVNVDLYGEIASPYDITTYPSFVIVKDGVMLDKKVGTINDIDFANWYNNVITFDRNKK